MKRIRKWLGHLIISTLGLFYLTKQERRDMHRALNEVMN